MDVVVNIASTLADAARSKPFATAVVCPAGRDASHRAAYSHWTFQQLDRVSDVLALGLTRIGIGQGVRTTLMVKPSLEFFALTFALFKAGAIPVLIDPGMGIRSLGKCFQEATPTGFIGIPFAQVARRVFGWGRETIRIVVAVDHRGSSKRRIEPLMSGVDGGKVSKYSIGDLYEAGRATADETASSFRTSPKQPGDLAAILFTSGSTGPPKGAEYTHGMFTSQIKILRDVYGIEPGEIDLCTFPLFALFGPALGMTSIIPEMDATRPARVDPTKIIEAIENFGVTNMFGSPALLRRVAEFGVASKTKLPSLRRVVSAGAPVPARTLEQFARMLSPGVQIFTPYGATESLPVASIGSDEILRETRLATDRGAGVCVGKPVPEMSVKVIPIRDEPIAEWSADLEVDRGTIGEIVVQGPVVSRAYFQRPDANRLAKIVGPDGTIRHRMGDVGYFDRHGRLWFCGRKPHRVLTETGTLFTIPCEAVFNVHPDVRRSALVGIGPAHRQTPILCVEPNRWPLTRSARAKILSDLRAISQEYEHTRTIGTFLFHKAFPVDIRHNSKIFREKLATWAARKIR